MLITKLIYATATLTASALAQRYWSDDDIYGLEARDEFLDFYDDIGLAARDYDAIDYLYEFQRRGGSNSKEEKLPSYKKSKKDPPPPYQGNGPPNEPHQPDNRMCAHCQVFCHGPFCPRCGATCK